jgi:chromosome segregation ATPase
MATPGGSPGSAPPSPAMHRESRWLGQGYADITKLRELAAKHERLGTRFKQRAARVQTRIEKLRHAATILREKAQRVLGLIPEVQQEVSQLERNIQAGSQQSGVLGSDVTSQQVRVRKLQQKIINLQHRSRVYEHRAAVRTQKSAELKIKVDQFLEQSRTAELEAQSFRQRADRLQLATEGEVNARLNAPPGTGNPPAGPP